MGSEMCIRDRFQNTAGRWSVIARKVWDDQPVRGVIEESRFLIREANITSGLREDLEATEVTFSVYTGGTVSSVRVNEVTQATVERRARVGTRSFTIPEYLVFLPQVPGSVQPVDDLIAEGPPTVLEFTVIGVTRADVTEDELWLPDVGFRVLVTVDNVRYDGLLLHKRITQTDGQSLEFRYTVWVLNAERLDIAVLIWDEGSWDEGDWA